ncbi:MAG TPA: alpha/beta fold hydrolase [Candidatus Paceibacterota bacterium]
MFIHVKKLIPFFIIILFMFIFPRISQANPLRYVNLIKISGDFAILEIRGLENKNYYSCNIKTLICEAIPKLPTEPSVSVEKTIKSSIKFPSNSSRRNISQTGNFGFYSTVDTAKGTRTMGLIDGKNKKNYSIKENLNFWNLLDEQPHISRFAQDDSTLTYMSDRSGFASLYSLSLKNLSNKNFQGTQITSGVSVGDFIYADSKTILYVANTKSDPYNWVLYSYNLTTKKKNILVENLVYDTILHQSGNSIIFTKLTPLGTLPVVITDFKEGGEKEFTGLSPSPLDTKSITYTYKNINSLNTVEMKNINTDTTIKHSLIVWLHGGPYRQGSYIRHPYISYGVYDWILEEAVSKGAYVLKIDYPGSYGSGRTFTQSIKNQVGKIDINSVMNAITIYKKTHEINNTYVIGNSYGGYLALKFMTSYPDKIDGGLSINGVTDWGSLLNYYKNSIFNTFFNGIPSSINKKLFAQALILNNIKNIKNPLYIIQGDIDSTIPKSQALLLKKALDDTHKISTLTIIADENHVFLKNSSINTICKSLFEMTQLDATNSCNLEG